MHIILLYEVCEMGRKTKFNDVTVDTIITAHSNGLPMKYCADLAGIARRTLYDWIEQGKKSKKGKKHDFYIKFVKARSQFILYHMKKINQAEDWRSSQYILSVIDKEEFSPKFEHDVNNDVNVKGDLNVKKSLDERLKENEGTISKFIEKTTE